MNLTLARQDPALRALPRIIPGAVVMGVLVRAWPDGHSALESFGEGSAPPGFMPMMLLFTALGLLWLANGNTWARCGRLHVGLPLGTRRLWMVRMISLAACGVAPMLVVGLILGLRFASDPLRVSVLPIVVSATLQVAAVLVLAAVLFQAPLLDRYRLGATPEYVVYCLGVGACLLVLVGASLPSVATAALVFTLAAVIGAVIWFRLPPAFSVVSRPSGFDEGGSRVETGATLERDEAAGRAPRRSPGSPAARRLLHLTVSRTLMGNPLTVLLWACMLGYSFMFTEQFFEGRSYPLALLLIAVWHLPAFQLAVARMDHLDPLPISRRVLFGHVAGPLITAVLAGAALAVVAASAQGERRAQIRYSGCCVQVPGDLFEVTRSSEAPLVIAPWGEAHRPRLGTVVAGLRIGVYNPYETDSSSSPRFVDWQLRRAVGALSGPTPTVPEGASEAAIDPSIIGGVARGSFTPAFARGGWPGRRGRTGAGAAIVTAVVTSSLLVLYLMQFSSRRGRRRFKWAVVVMLVFFGLVVVGSFVIDLLGLGDMGSVEILVSVGFRQFGESIPLPTAGVWLLALAVLVSGYLVVRSRFQRIEVPGRSILTPYAEDY